MKEQQETYKEIAKDLIDGNVNNCIVEASAGTGKTYTIENLIVELIKQSKDFALSRLLIVTFTDKAAGELKERILKALKSCNSQNDKNPYIQKAIDSIDTAQISTFHSFSQKTMADYAYDANLPFSFDLVNKNGLNSLIEQTARDEWNGVFTEIVPKGADPEKIISLVKKILEKYNEDSVILPEVNTEKFKEYQNKGFSSKEIQEISFLDFKSTSTYKKIKTILENIISILEKYKDESFDRIKNNPIKVNELLENLKNWNEDKKIDIKYFNSKWFTNLKNAHKETTDIEDKINEINTLTTLATTKTACKNIGKSIIESFATKIAGEIYNKWKLQKKENKQQTFDDLISNVYHEVVKESSPLKLALQNKYRMVIIDEFQDTNSIQWSIFRSIFLNEDHNILVVGDPKQSIYAFQGADVEIYKNAIEELKAAKGKVYELRKNFRSSKAMIEACNQIFISKDNNGLFGDKSQKISEAESGKPDDNIAYLQDKPIEEPIWMFSSETKNEYIKFCIERLTELFQINAGNKTAMQIMVSKDPKTTRNLKFSDIAILVRNSNQFKDFESALDKAGIPHLRYKDTSLFKGKECVHWEWLLRAINTPNNSREHQYALRAAFLTDFFKNFFSKESTERFNQIENYSFNTMVSSDNKDSLLKMIFDWHKLATKKEWILMMESIYKETGIESALAKDLCGLSKFRQIGDYILEKLLSNTMTLEGLCKHLQAMNNNTEQSDSVEDSTNTVAKGSDIDAVQLMTMHASKGLQFPVVIIGGGEEGKIKNITISLDQLVDVNGQKKRKEVFGHSNTEIDEQESKRLFYVAYTRAEYILFVWDQNSPKKASPNEMFLSESLKKCTYVRKTFEALDNKSIQQYINSVKPTENYESQTNDLATKLEALKIDEKIIKQRAYSFLVKHHKDISIQKLTGEINEENRENIPDENTEYFCEKIQSKLPRGKYFGNAMHKIFELIDFTEITGNKNSDWQINIDAEKNNFAFGPKIEKTIKKAFEEEFLNFDEKRQGYAIANLLKNVLDAPIKDRDDDFNGKDKNGFKLKDISLQNTKREMLFQYTSNKKEIKLIIKGFIDLLFVRECNGQKRYYIIDWKSDELEDYDDSPNGSMALQVEKCEYSIQKVLYVYYLILWLQNFYQEEPQIIFDKFFGGIYYVFARGAENNKKCILPHDFTPKDLKKVDENNNDFSFWDFPSLEKAFKKIIKTRVSGDSNV